MLIGIPALLHADLLHVLASMGHGDELVLADANFPAARLARRLVHMPGIETGRAAETVLKLLPLDDFVAAPLALMQPARPQDKDTPALKDLTGLLSRIAPGKAVEQIERDAFYARAANAFAIVATGDARPYANLILKKGVIAQGMPGHVD